MILPINIYNHPVLRVKCSDINSDYDNLDKLINNMFETMHNANGVGLAAPQIGLSISLFVIDLTPFLKDYSNLKTTKKVFINPEIQEETGNEWAFNEGCLSIPDIREDVARKEKIKIKYFDEKFNMIEEKIEGIEARVIQHEYDHLQGVLFIDFLSGERKNIINRKLKNIIKGKFEKNYPYKLFKK
tara:strand:+ start:329 stop:886 length:558 start_codon:yes stop_codon:yes gene_type:complete